MERPNYPSDLSQKQWEIIAPLVPSARPGGRPRTADVRQVINAILYLVRSGCAWRMLPSDFPPWSTVHGYYRRFRLAGIWQEIHDSLREQVRVEAGREATPSAAIIDSQSVKTTEKGGVRGYDAGKKINGRKRHIVVDTIGLILAVVVHSAGIQERDGAKLVLSRVIGRFPRLLLIWADGGYAGKLVDWVKEVCHWTLQIVKRSDDAVGFVLLPRRWVVERTFAWLGRYRRMSKDYEELAQSSECMIMIAMINLMSRRLARCRA